MVRRMSGIRKLDLLFPLPCGESPCARGLRSSTVTMEGGVKAERKSTFLSDFRVSQDFHGLSPRENDAADVEQNLIGSRYTRLQLRNALFGNAA